MSRRFEDDFRNRNLARGDFGGFDGERGCSAQIPCSP